MYANEKILGQLKLKQMALWVDLMHADEEVPRQFKAKPAARHTRGDFEQIRNNAFVHAANAFLSNDDTDGVPNRFVLVADAGHGVDLKSSSQYVARRVSGHGE